MPTPPVAGIILAAGKGTRMKSELPKGLHHVCGLPMVELVGRAMKQAGVKRPIVVIGHGGEAMQAELGDGYDYVWQRDQLGTGHAALMAQDLLKNHHGAVLIAPGDTPLLTGDVLTELVDLQSRHAVACVMATTQLADPTGYGRILREADGSVGGVVEHKDASGEQQNIREINPSIYCFDGGLLFEILPNLSNQNAQGAYYLTDVIGEIRRRGGKVNARIFPDAEVFQGVNDRWQLSQCERVLRFQILKRHALNGVTLVDPESTHIEPDVEIGQDTVIEPATYLRGVSRIGSNCRIGPGSRVNDSTIEDGCSVLYSQVNEATMRRGSKCGPFTNLRPGAVLGEGARVGNFVEIKNSTMGEKSAANHLTYIGDTSVGDRTNVGAGTITCNYDGFGKHRTEIGSDAFVGSNSTLVAPVTIGDGAMIAAGSVVTKSVPNDALGIGRAKTEVKEGWVSQWRKRRTMDKA
jgi:bifunctional UDP-N-acetylglucosamine pyrophosphorylase / glucosamine-1-phosphate N-acetyltransferase